MPELLIIDDDKVLCETLSRYLGKRGFSLRHAYDGAEGLRAIAEVPVDTVLLDVMLPDLDGFEVCRRIRAFSQVPILMLTARGDHEDRIVGLELGADDYVPKPFNPAELLARIRALLRRADGSNRRGERMIRFGRLEIDRDAHRASLGGGRCALTVQQFEILRVLAESPGQVFSRDALRQRIGGDPEAASDRSIDVQISRIRAEIEEHPQRPSWILTVRGIGYVFAPGPSLRELR